MLLTPILSAALAIASPSHLVVHDCRFGEVYAFSRVECTARLENTGSRPMKLRIMPEPLQQDVAPIRLEVPVGESVAVPLRASLGNDFNRISKFYRVEIPGSDAPPIWLKAQGFAMSALDQARPAIEFGSVDVADPPTRMLSLSSRETARFRISGIRESPAQLDVRILPDGHSIEARVRRDADWGELDGFIKLAIDTPRQKEAWVAVRGEIHGPVMPTSNPAWFGIIAAGREQTVQVTELRRRDGETLDARVAKLEGVDGEASVVPCAPAAENCRVLHVTLAESQPGGMARGTVTLELPNLKRDLRIGFQGLLTSPDGGTSTVANDSGAASGSMLAMHPSGGSVPSAVPARAGKLAGERAETAMPVDAPPGTGPLLKWAASDQRSVHGYQVYRSDSESGPFVLLNSPTIPVDAQGESASSYQWRDTSATPGKTYWYYVGVVYNDGRKEKITPEMKALAK